MKNNKIYGLIGLARRARKISFGTESVEKAIDKKRVKLVIVATDASDRTKKNFEMKCENVNTEYRIFGTIEELSSCIGQVNKAVIGIEDENFSKELIKRIDGGEFIG